MTSEIESNITRFEEDAEPPVRGFVHHPHSPPALDSRDALVLTHGAGSSCEAPLLVAIATLFAGAGVTVLRCDLPFRQMRPKGPPFPTQAERDRVGLHNALQALRKMAGQAAFGRVFAGGHSYGGRQFTLLAARHPKLVQGLLLFSYPLHPPGRPAQLRSAHFPDLQIPALFVQGARDPFGSLDEMEAALRLIPGPTHLLAIEDAGHDLAFGRQAVRLPSQGAELPQRVLAAFQSFFRQTPVIQQSAAP